MGIHRGAIIVLGAALLGAAGCTSTGAIDSMSTTSTGGSAVRSLPASGDLAEGKAHFRSANFGLAERHFRKAVELEADNPEAWMGLAASYDQLGRFDFADRAYDQLVKIAGRQPRVVSNMGYSQLLRGNRGKARSLLEEARRGLPGDAVIEANLKLLSSS